MIKTLKRFITDIPWIIKHFFQRGKRGWADCDTFSMDNYLISVILPMLRHLKKNMPGYPGTFKSPEEWDIVMDSMIIGFEAGERILDDDYMDTIQPGWYKDPPKDCSIAEIFESCRIEPESWEKYKEITEKDEELFHSGMDLFNKHFFGLWE